MKRMLCILLTALMLFPAAGCVQLYPGKETERPAEENPTGIPGETTTEDPVLDPRDQPIVFEPIENPPIQFDEPIGKPPIELTDPIPPVYDPMGGAPEVGGYADFTNLLSAALLSGTQNRNLSPISVYLALAMVTEGAKGETQAELLKLLGCSSIEDLRGICGGMLERLSIDEEGSTLDIHDSLWMAKEIGGMPVSIREDYLKRLADIYRSEANAVEFGTKAASKQIADWINEQTRGKINVSPDAMNFDPGTLAVLINTIYLKDGWAEKFDEKATESGEFKTPDGTMDVDYMSRRDDGRAVRFGEGWMAYRVYLSRIGWVTFVLPDEDVPLDTLFGSPDAIDKLLHSGAERTYDVSLKIPKFEFLDKMELSDVLKALGIPMSFTSEADFTGISDTSSCIDRVIQESYIGVDENGIEAAAYTMISMKTTGFHEPVEREKIDFHLTRPFFYAIETYEGEVLFIGTVTNPSAAE